MIDMLKNRYIISNRILSAIILTAFSCQMVACGTGAESGKVSDVELVDPVVGVPSYAVAEYRTIYDADVYPAHLCPTVTEYSYETAQPFGGYGSLYGETVDSGDILLYGNTEDIEREMKEFQESIDELNQQYDETYADYQQDLNELNKKIAEVGTTRNAIIGNGPQEGDPGYDFYQAGLMPIEGEYKRLVLQKEHKEEEIYELEQDHKLLSEHNNNLLNIMSSDKSDVVIESQVSGTVVAAGMYRYGDHIDQGTNVVAVADDNDKVFKCEFINQNDIVKAQEIYAVVDGKKYEVIPEIIDRNDYQRLSSEYGAVFSSFRLKDENNFEFGKYGAIVVVHDVRENVLCVPTDAISKEASEEYVNIFADGQTTRVAVKTGIKDNMYTEILSGVSAGDYIISNSAVSAGKITKTLEKGDISAEYSESGFLYFPASEMIRNPVEEGTCYIKEILVEEFEQVKAGQAVAVIEVKTDTVEIDRINRQIQRENERLADLELEASKDYSNQINYTRNRAIRARKKNIERLNKQLNKLSKYAGTHEITAPYDGMIMSKIDFKEGDLLANKGDVMSISSFERCYVIVEDKKGQLNYGNNVTVTYKDQNAISHSVEGKVVTINNMCLTTDLKNDYVGIALNPGEASAIISEGSSLGGNGWYRTWFSIETSLNAMDDVVLVPKSAVKSIKNSYYVKVMDDNGVKYISFIPGGSDTMNYWVAEGLSEGMVICYD